MLTICLALQMKYCILCYHFTVVFYFLFVHKLYIEIQIWSVKKKRSDDFLNEFFLIYNKDNSIKNVSFLNANLFVSEKEKNMS